MNKFDLAAHVRKGRAAMVYAKKHLSPLEKEIFEAQVRKEQELPRPKVEPMPTRGAWFGSGAAYHKQTVSRKYVSGGRDVHQVRWANA